MNQPLRSHRVIPQTAMRRFYDLLRNFPSYEFHLAALNECLRVPLQLDNMIQRSFGHVSQYENGGEPFHDRGPSGVPTQKRRESSKLPDRFVRLLSEGRVQANDELFRFTYVDYEVDPLRTTGGAKFEDGRPASSGGIDALLSHQVDHLPIVGEVKAAKDATLFLALIQSLTYAIELVTPTQRRRLLTAYPDRFEFPETSSHVDIYLIQVNPPKDDWAAKFMSGVEQLSAKLLAQPFSSGILRRIACLSAPDLDRDSVLLSTSFVHTSGAEATEGIS